MERKSLGLFFLLLLVRWWCRRREESVSHRATGSRVRARVTTTVRWSAGTKVSPVASAEGSATAAFAPRFVEI
ncbi:hypothetical protein E2542_SST02511 [Spatholobus suberectus]|nr:hypothetical protein E2542_SST02511 [Spatholobus suberectus]